MAEEQRYIFVFCLHCRYDVEHEEGYLEAKHWDFCPRCGTKLVRRPNPNYTPRWGVNEDGSIWFKGDNKK